MLEVEQRPFWRGVRRRRRFARDRRNRCRRHARNASSVAMKCSRNQWPSAASFMLCARRLRRRPEWYGASWTQWSRQVDALACSARAALRMMGVVDRPKRLCRCVCAARGFAWIGALECCRDRACGDRAGRANQPGGEQRYCCPASLWATCLTSMRGGFHRVSANGSPWRVRWRLSRRRCSSMSRSQTSMRTAAQLCVSSWAIIWPNRDARSYSQRKISLTSQRSAKKRWFSKMDDRSRRWIPAKSTRAKTGISRHLSRNHALHTERSRMPSRRPRKRNLTAAARTRADHGKQSDQRSCPRTTRRHRSYTLRADRPDRRNPDGRRVRRVTASVIHAAEMLPAFARSSMDGYAVVAVDRFGASESAPAKS